MNSQWKMQIDNSMVKYREAMVWDGQGWQCLTFLVKVDTKSLQYPSLDQCSNPSTIDLVITVLNTQSEVRKIYLWETAFNVINSYI